MTFKSTKYSSKYISRILLGIFTFNTVFLPYDNFGLKKVSFILLIFLNLCAFQKINLKDKKNQMLIMVAVFLTTYTIVKSAILTGNLISDFLSGYSGYILLLYFVICFYDFDFCKLLTEMLTLLSCFMIIVVCLDVLGIVPIFDNMVLKFLCDTENMTLGRGSEYLTHYYLFIKTTPMLLLALAYLLEKRRYINSIIVFLAILLSGTRANILVGTSILMIGLVLSNKDTQKRIIFLLCVIVGGLFLVWKMHLISYFITRFQAKHGSDMVRSLTLKSILAIWKDNPIKFIIGQGYSGKFYNVGRLDWAIDAELSYWNLLRRIGFLSFFLMMLAYIYPIVRLLKKRYKIIIIIGYIGYLMVAYTNPLLYTSTGITIVLFMYCIA